MTDDLRQRLRAIYAEVDAAVAASGPKCDASGRCCRFKEWGHVLYLSMFEAEILLDAAPPYEKPVSPETCPFQIDNLCTARDPRPLGCRIYFCDPSYQDTAHEITESALRKLKQLADQHALEWRYAPLHVFLNEGERGRVSAPSQGNRISLPISASGVASAPRVSATSGR